MLRDNENRQYTRDWLQYERQQPMYDETITDFYEKIFIDSPVHKGLMDEEFVSTFSDWLSGHTLSNFRGIEEFKFRHVIQGCTQFIDDLYQRCGEIQTFEKDYKYHYRLNPKIEYTTIENLRPDRELLISMPFPYFGDVHPGMNEILNKCEKMNIPVHIDGAWIGCIRDIDFDFSHPAIKTFGVSLSKAGIGGNRIGVRFAREEPEGAITIMNKFHMNQQPLMYIGIEFMKNFGPEYFWKKYSDKYYKICDDFSLRPTNAIHIAMDDNKPVGIRSLLRAL